MKIKITVLLLIFCIISQAQSVILSDDFNSQQNSSFTLFWENQSSSFFSNGNIVLTGGIDSLWTGNANNTSSQNAWNDNIEHHASASTQINAQNFLSLELKVRVKLTASASLNYSWFRVLVNGVQVSSVCGESNYNPLTLSSDNFRILTFDLSQFAGSQFYLTLQASCKLYQTDVVFLDNVVLYGSGITTSLTIPYSQNFESAFFPYQWKSCSNGNSLNWINGSSLNSSIPANSIYAGSVNVVNDGIISNTYLQTPNFNFLYQQNIVIQFSACSNMNAYLIGSSNGGTTFNDTISVINTSSLWQNFSFNLVNYSNLPNVCFRFVHIDNSNNNSFFAIDNFSLQSTNNSTVNAGIISLISPISSTLLSSNEIVTVSIKNFGTTTISNFPVSYCVNNGNTISEMCSQSIAANQTLNYSFQTAANLSLAGTYNFKIWPGLAYDVNLQNDTLLVSVQVSETTISTFPYFDNFESQTLWTSGGTNSSWQCSNPSSTFISSAASGTHAWVTNPTGQYNMNEASYVSSPNLDFSDLNSPNIQFDVICNSVLFEDGTCVQYSLDHGVTWHVIGDVGEGENWYNSAWVTALYFTGNSQGWNGTPFLNWVSAKHSLSFLAHEESVKLRFFFGSTENLDSLDGFAFDNVMIYDSPSWDIGVSELLYPIGDCLLGTVEHPIVTISNFGLNAVSGFYLNSRINSGTIYSQLITQTIASNASINVALNQSYNFSSPGIFNLKTWTIFANDQNLFNDSLISEINITNSYSLPFTENFETATLPANWTRTQNEESNGWLFGDNLGSYYFNIPAHTHYAASNDDECNCDMSADFLITPHLNFSIYDNITLHFDAFNPGNYGSSGHIKVSTDCGLNWTNVYDLPSNTTSWQSLNVDLSAFSGFNQVKIAFHHDDGGDWASGFAIDNVTVSGTVSTVVQNINLPQGWSIFSTYINTTQSINSLVSPVVNHLFIVKDESGAVYWPQYGVNNIGNVILCKAYQVKMNSQAILPVTGIPLIPEMTTISLPQGWSLLGYIRQSDAPVNLMLNLIVNSILIVKNENGQVYWPTYNVNTIGNMNPGKGYQIRMYYPENFTYPSN